MVVKMVKMMELVNWYITRLKYTSCVFGVSVSLLLRNAQLGIEQLKTPSR